jgi:hypothetical protein
VHMVLTNPNLRLEPHVANALTTSLNAQSE